MLHCNVGGEEDSGTQREAPEAVSDEAKSHYSQAGLLPRFVDALTREWKATGKTARTSAVDKLVMRKHSARFAALEPEAKRNYDFVANELRAKKKHPVEHDLAMVESE